MQPQQGLLGTTKLISSAPWGHCHRQPHVSASSQLSKQDYEGSQWLTIPEGRLGKSLPTLTDWEKKSDREEWRPQARKEATGGESQPVYSSTVRQIPTLCSKAFNNCYSPTQGMKRTAFDISNGYLQWEVATKMIFIFSSRKEKCIFQVHDQHPLFLLAFAC